MKRFFGFVMFLVFAFGVSAQDDEETLFQGPIEHGGFGGPVVKFTRVKDTFGLLVGGRGGWIINHSLCIGGGGYGLVNQIPADDVPGLLDLPLFEPVLGMGYGGFELEYVHASNRLVHSTVSILIGGGAVGLQEGWSGRPEWDWDWNHTGEIPNWDAFFIVEPGLNAEVNIARFFRIDAGVGYRFVSGVERIGLANGDIGGPAISLTFKFGKF